MNNGDPGGQNPRQPGNQQPYAGYQQNSYGRQGGYAQQGRNQSPQGGYPPQPNAQQGAVPPQGGYGAYPQQGGYAPYQQGVSNPYGPGGYSQQPGNPYAQGGYQPNPYAQGAYQGVSSPYGQKAYPQNQQGAYGQGAAGQSNPYAQGYQGQPNPYAQGYQGQPNPYAQGYQGQSNPYVQGYQGQSNPYAQGYQGPMNPYPQQGGQQGYVVQPPAQPKGPGLSALLSRIPWQAAAAAVSFTLFAAAMITRVTLLGWLFAGCAFLTLGWLWLQPKGLGKNARLTVTALLLIALVLTAIRLATGGAADPRTTGTAPGNPGAQDQTGQTAQTGSEGSESLGGLQTLPTDPPTTMQPQTQASVSGEIEERLQSFMYFWQNNDLDKMLNYCAPSWSRSIPANTNARNSLFNIMALRIPEKWDFSKINGSDADVSATVVMTAVINKNNMGAPQTYIFNVLMLKEDGSWFVDPRSLQSNVEATATPVSGVVTQPPQPATSAEADLVLYYNLNGGTYYHTDPYCKSANERYLPFQGKVTYKELNDEKYRKLEPCPYCNPPLRPGS